MVLIHSGVNPTLKHCNEFLLGTALGAFCLCWPLSGKKLDASKLLEEGSLKHAKYMLP